MSTKTNKISEVIGKPFQLGDMIVQTNEIEKLIQTLGQMNKALEAKMEEADKPEDLQELLLALNAQKEARAKAIQRQSLSTVVKMLNNPSAVIEMQITAAGSRKVEIINISDKDSTANAMRSLLRDTDRELKNLLKELKK